MNDMTFCASPDCKDQCSRKAMFDCGDDAPWADLYKAMIKAAHEGMK